VALNGQCDCAELERRGTPEGCARAGYSGPGPWRHRLTEAVQRERAWVYSSAYQGDCLRSEFRLGMRECSRRKPMAAVDYSYRQVVAPRRVAILWRSQTLDGRWSAGPGIDILELPCDDLEYHYLEYRFVASIGLPTRTLRR
jgi:hypothetical protein